MLKRIYNVIEPGRDSSTTSTVYAVGMMLTILLSLIPLASKTTNTVFSVIETISTAIFCVDYILRFLTADMKLEKGVKSFLIYPVTPLAIIDLAAILPSFISVLPGLRMLKIFRLLRTFRVFRAFKIFRYSRNIIIICNVIKKQKSALLAVAALALGYVLISALAIFNVEPDTFGSYFEAVYWATVSLTTVGYGDLYPVTQVGRTVAMLSSFIGIAIVALPAGIVTAGYMDELRKFEEAEEDADRSK